MNRPVHGFVLAGGRSTRMGRDKASLLFHGVPMVETAVRTLTAVCEKVSIAGNRDDLTHVAPIVRETRLEEGPVSGIEAGLQSCASEWAMFLPVDLPLMPSSLLQRWVDGALIRPWVRASYLRYGLTSHPALCLIRRDAFGEVIESIAAGHRRVETVLSGLSGFWLADGAEFADPIASKRSFMNVNTPNDLSLAEQE